MTLHAENALRCPSISKIVDLAFAVAAFEAGGAEGLVASQDGQVLDFVVTSAAAICAIIADERTVAKEEKIGIGVEEGPARIASKAVNVPPVAGWRNVSNNFCDAQALYSPNSNAFPSSRT